MLGVLLSRVVSTDNLQIHMGDRMKHILLVLLISSLHISSLSAEIACHGGEIPEVKSSSSLEAPKRLRSEFFATADRLLGDATIMAVDPALFGLVAVPGQTLYLLRAAAFMQVPNHFTARAANGKVYVSAHMLGSRRGIEPVVLTLFSPAELSAVECATFAVR